MALCMLATITSLFLWLIGFQAENDKLHYEIQANTVKKTRVLSFLFLAKQILQHDLIKVTMSGIYKTMTRFQIQYNLLTINDLEREV